MHELGCPSRANSVDSLGYGGATPAYYGSGFQPERTSAFTLVELMVVMLIIGVLASFAIPAMKGLGQANRSAAAHRQILDDLALARLKAINDRANVYVVFAAPLAKAAFTATFPLETASQRQKRLKQLTNLLGQTFTGYALVSTRTVGDQPGRPTPHYLTEWRSLPDGFVFAPYKFADNARNLANEYARTWIYKSFPFPSSRSLMTNALPCIGFNAQGQLISQRDEVLTLAKGSVFPARLADGTLAVTAPDVQLNPPVNQSLPPVTQTNTYQFVRINWLTGRARVELPEFRQ
jgi:prepilin-type N-terminal cleavage/methylation domain-containing protein